MKPIFWCFVLGHKWGEPSRSEFGDGVDVAENCARCGATGQWNTTQGSGKPEPTRPGWQEVRNAPTRQGGTKV